MKQLKKGLSGILIFLILINLVTAQTVVNRPEPAKPKGFFDTTISFIKSPIFLGIVVFLVIFLALIILITFILIKILKYLKLRNDAFYRLKIERIKLAKNQRRFIKSKHWWKIEKNVPLRLVKKNEEGNLVITQPIAYYRGDFIGNEGNVVLAVNFENRKKWWIFPLIDLLIIPNNRNMDITKGKEKIELTNIPNAKEIVKFLDNEVLIYADSISSSGMFFFPVVKDQKGKILDLAMPVFQSLKEVIVEDYLYAQTSEFVDIARKSMDLNPQIRAIQKTQDQNQSVEIPENRRV